MDIIAWWIGDPVQVISTGLKGRYHGPGQAGDIIIKLPDGNLINIPVQDVRLAEEEIETDYKTIQWLPEKAARAEPGSSQSYRLDLHYENLTRHFTHPPDQTILEYQLDICNRFALAAIESRTPFIRIIHGRGTGVLRNEVERLLKKYPEFTLISFNPNMASVDAWIK